MGDPPISTSTDVPPPKSKRNDVREAYLALGVSPAAVSAQPSIRHELARIGREIRRAANVPASPYYYLSLSDDVDARRVLDAYHSVSPRWRRYLPIEAFCVKAQVPTTQLYDSVLVAMQRSNRLVSAAIVSATHPRVVRETIAIATDSLIPPETRLSAQQVLHRAVGFTPLPRHAQTIVNVSAAASSSAQSAAAASAPGSVESPERTIRRLSERLNALRPATPAMLPMPAPAPVEEIPESVTPLIDADFERVPAHLATPIDAPFAPRPQTLRWPRIRDGQIVMEEEVVGGTEGVSDVSRVASQDDSAEDEEADEDV